MHSSITSSRLKSGRNARRVSASAEASAPPLALSGGLEFIHRPEIQIPRDQYLDAVALMLDHRRGNVDGSLQHLRHDILCARRIDDHGAAVAAARLNRGLNAAVEDRHQRGCAEAFPKMSIHAPRQPGTAQFVCSW